MRRTRNDIWRFLLLLIPIIVFTTLPLISATLAEWLANLHGCALHEGDVSACVILGADRGDMLYSMLVAGWLALITIPAGLVLLIGWLFLFFGKLRETE
jgi:hypothetical protein